MIKIQEDEPIRGVQMLNSLDEVVLETEQAQAGLRFQNGNSCRDRQTGLLRNDNLVLEV